MEQLQSTLLIAAAASKLLQETVGLLSLAPGSTAARQIEEQRRFIKEQMQRESEMILEHVRWMLREKEMD